MTIQRWEQVKELLHQAMQLIPEQRSRFLDEACSSDNVLRAEVESLLLADEDVRSSFMQSAPCADEFEVSALSKIAEITPSDGEERVGAVAAGNTPNLPASIGQYRIFGLLGEGGMGVVYEAEQEHPRRTVALKVIKSGLVGPEPLRRFEQESQALGRLQHPGIAQIYEAGTADSGFGPQPYFAMELIRGESLLRYAEARQLNTRQRLDIMTKVCDAVHHAHQRGIIHRDLKPGNILVDESGEPKILDFGVARMTDSDAQATRQTDVGHLLGTLAYMSPEQVLADPLEVDTRSDVYALGVIMYELLAARLPYTVSRNLPEAVHTIRTEDPARLSSISRNYRGDIETIVAKALEKDKVRRYASAAGLAGDIRRYLTDQPIMARPPSASYQLQKFARRHKALVAGVSVVFIVLVAGIIVSTWEATRARRAEQVATAERNRAVGEKKRADAESATAKAVNEFLQNDLLAQASANVQAQPTTKPDPDLKVRTVLDRAAARIPGKFDSQPLVEASIRQTIGNAYRDLGLYLEAQQHMERALAIRQRFLGEDYPDTLETMNEVAELYFEYQGKSAQAEPLLTKVLEVRRRVLGEEHLDTLTSASNLAAFYRQQGKYAPAEPLFTKVLEVRRRLLGEEHPSTLDSMDDLAALYRLKGKYAQAEPLFTKVLELRRRVLGELHPDTLSSMNNLALLYQDQGKYAQAEPLSTSVVEAWRRVLGEEHPSTLTGLGNLGLLYQDQGKYTQAEPLLTKVLELRRRVLGELHPDTLIEMNNLAVLYRLEGKYAQAEPLFTSVVEAWRHVLGEEHPYTLNGMNSLALVYLKESKYAQAEPLLRDALKRFEKAMPNMWSRFNCESLLGATLAGQKNYAEAEALLLSGYEGLRQQETAIPAFNRYRPREAGEWILKLYRDWGKPEKAAEWQKKLNSIASTSRKR